MTGTTCLYLYSYRISVKLDSF